MPLRYLTMFGRNARRVVTQASCYGRAARRATTQASCYPHGSPRRGPLLCQESGLPVDMALLAAETELVALPELDGLKLHLITHACRLYHSNGFRECPFPAPWWAFCWPGSYCIARHLQQHPELVRGKRVLDFAAGGGPAALVAARCGAAHVVCNDVCAWALASCQLNAAANGITIPRSPPANAAAAAFAEEDLVLEDLVGNTAVGGTFDVILAGDIMYEQPLAGYVTDWLREMAAQGTEVLLGDPGRAFLPTDGLQQVAEFDLPGPHVRDSSNGLHTGQVWKVAPSV